MDGASVGAHSCAPLPADRASPAAPAIADFACQVSLDTSSKSLTKSDHERLAQQVCHPEPFGFAQDKLREGSRGQILRCAQNDTSERLRRKVYQCRAFRFSSVARLGRNPGGRRPGLPPGYNLLVPALAHSAALQPCSLHTRFPELSYVCHTHWLCLCGE